MDFIELCRSKAKRHFYRVSFPLRSDTFFIEKITMRKTKKVIIPLDDFSDCDGLEFSIYGNAKYLGNKSNPYLVLVGVTATTYKRYEINPKTCVILENAFKNCKRLTHILIPYSVKSIGGCVFFGCSALKSVTIGNSLRAIPNAAFACCLNLSTVFIPDSIASIGNGAFYHCDALTSVHYGGTIEKWNAIKKGLEWGSNVEKVVGNGWEIAEPKCLQDD